MNDWQLSEAEYIRLDLFPANVTVTTPGDPAPPGPYTDRARVIVTDADIYVWLDAIGGPAVDRSGVLFDVGGDNRTGYYAQLEDGTRLDFIRSSNCGCGSRLRGLAPFPGVGYAEMIGR